MRYLRMMGIVLGVNLLPAFGPPTWSVLVVLSLKTPYAPGWLVVLAALAAATGRTILAVACRTLRHRFSPQRRAHLEVARQALTKSPRRSLAGLALFALSPLPSAQLFEAAGLMGLSLAPIVGVFFAGRLVSYSAYVAGVHVLRTSTLGGLVAGSLAGPWGIALQVVFLAGVVVLARVDWLTVARLREPVPPAAGSRREPGSSVVDWRAVEVTDNRDAAAR